MPGVFNLSRRHFLKSTAIAGAAIISGCKSAPKQTAIRPPGEKPLHYALLSDTHIPADRKSGTRGFNPWANLKQIMPDVVAAKPDAVILNGDIARQQGLLPDYNEARELLHPAAANCPVYLALGNHDDRANFKKVFDHPSGKLAGVADKHIVIVDEPALRFVILDSLLYTNKTAGLLGQTQRAWLADYLATNSEKPHILFVHHTLGDRDGELLDARRLFDIIHPHPQVKAIFYGHSHEWNMSEREGVKLVNLPAVGYNFRDNEPVGWVDAKFDSTGADLTLHAIGGNTTDSRKVHRVSWA